MELFSERVEELVAFYASYFSSKEEARDFIVQFEKIGEERRNALIILHQTQRLIYFADNAEKLKPGRDALKLLFLIMCTEAISKLYENYKGKGKAWEHIEKFFTQHCFIKQNYISSIKDLYKVRCDVVHEGQYWGFAFKNNDCDLMPLNGVWTYTELRDVVVRGAINSIRSYLNKK